MKGLPNVLIYFDYSHLDFVHSAGSGPLPGEESSRKPASE